MTFFAELSSVRAVAAIVTIPTFGIYHADITVDQDRVYAVTDRLVLTIGDLKLAVAPWRPAAGYGGKTRVRLVGGFGGWRTLLPEKSYRASAGVKLSLVLNDCAREAGEKIAIAGDRILGGHFTREGGVPAGRFLNSLVPGAWWVDPDGTTRTGARASSPIVSSFSVVDFDSARGVLTVATEKPSDFVPGRTLSPTSPKTTVRIGGVVHRMTDNALRTEVIAA